MNEGILIFVLVLVHENITGREFELHEQVECLHTAIKHLYRSLSYLLSLQDATAAAIEAKLTSKSKENAEFGKRVEKNYQRN